MIPGILVYDTPTSIYLVLIYGKSIEKKGDKKDFKKWRLTCNNKKNIFFLKDHVEATMQIPALVHPKTSSESMTNEDKCISY